MDEVERSNCPVCGEEFEVIHKGGQVKKYCSTRCRNRATETNRQDRDRAEYQRWRHILSKYNLTKEQFEEMFDNQGRCCAACGSDSPRSKYGWHIDHDHRTNMVRGILCMPCNTSLPDVDDQIDRLLGMVEYIRRFNKSVMTTE